jgi:hypothetical protein
MGYEQDAALRKSLLHCNWINKLQLSLGHAAFRKWNHTITRGSEGSKKGRQVLYAMTVPHQRRSKYPQHLREQRRGRRIRLPGGGDDTSAPLDLTTAIEIAACGRTRCCSTSWRVAPAPSGPRAQGDAPAQDSMLRHMLKMMRKWTGSKKPRVGERRGKGRGSPERRGWLPLPCPSKMCCAATLRPRAAASSPLAPPVPRLACCCSRLAPRRLGFDPEGQTRGMDFAVGVGFRNATKSVSFPILPEPNANFLMGLV